LAPVFVELPVNRLVDPGKSAHVSRHEGEMSWVRPATGAALCEASIIPPLQPEPLFGDLSPDRTFDAIYATAAGIRLELIYSPVITGELRKRWANRLGGINFLSLGAAAEIQDLRNELALHEPDWHDSLHLEIARIRHGLWRLRELCRRYQALAGSE
jgi:hypothetical protein